MEQKPISVKFLTSHSGVVEVDMWKFMDWLSKRGGGEFRINGFLNDLDAFAMLDHREKQLKEWRKENGVSED